MVAFALGCEGPMSELYYPEQWGQSQLFPAAAFVPGQPLPLLRLTNPQQGAYKPPRVRTLILGIENDDNTGQDYILRWRLSVGVGGARTEVDFDATRYSRVSLPFDECAVSLYADPFAGSTDTPANAIQAFAFAADGYAEQTMPGPIFSEFFDLVGAASANFPLPVGANRFRVIGEHPSGVTPFTVNTFVLTQAGAASVRSLIPGLGATPGVGDLLGVYGSDRFIPIASGATELEVLNVAGNAQGFVQFGLDL